MAALNHLDSDRRKGLKLAFCGSASRLVEVGEDEERATGVYPAGRLEQEAGRSAGLIELVIAAIGVGLQHA